MQARSLAYDGTDFVGWQRQANGRVDSGAARGRAARARRRAGDACTAPAAPTPACTRSARWRASRSTRAIDDRHAGRARSTRACRDAIRVLERVDGAPTRSTRASARRRRPTATASGTATSCRPFERALRLARRRARSTSTRCDAAPRRLIGRARFRGVSGAPAARHAARPYATITRARVARRRRRRRAAGHSRSTATASSATWSAASSARWSRSGAGGGRPDGSRGMLASRDRAQAGPTAPAARAVPRAASSTERDRPLVTGRKTCIIEV